MYAVVESRMELTRRGWELVPVRVVSEFYTYLDAVMFINLQPYDSMSKLCIERKQ